MVHFSHAVLSVRLGLGKGGLRMAPEEALGEKLKVREIQADIILSLHFVRSCTCLFLEQIDRCPWVVLLHLHSSIKQHGMHSLVVEFYFKTSVKSSAKSYSWYVSFSLSVAFYALLLWVLSLGNLSDICSYDLNSMNV